MHTHGLADVVGRLVVGRSHGNSVANGLASLSRCVKPGMEIPMTGGNFRPKVHCDVTGAL